MDSFLYFLFFLGLISFLYPFLGLISIKRKKYNKKADQTALILVPVSKKTPEVERKIKNLSSFKYLFRIVVAYDGIDKFDLKNEKIEEKEYPKVGKNYIINDIFSSSKEEALILSDADSEAEEKSYIELLKALKEEEIGGACSNLIIDKKGYMSIFWSINNKLKNFETSFFGSTTSTTGALCAIKREFFERMPLNVTDDLFLLLSVITKNKKFVYCPEAKAYSQPPAKDPRNQLDRRRRIINRSFRNFIYFIKNKKLFKIKKSLLCALIINKILRRFSCIFISIGSLANIKLYASICTFLIILGALKTNLFLYLIYENLGVILGIFDIFKGKSYEKW